MTGNRSVWTAVLAATTIVTSLALSAPSTVKAASKSVAYNPSFTGQVKAFRLSGVEPDGDPLDQVVLQTKLSAGKGIPPINMFISSYLENFRPDTTPILPDLLHPTQTAHNLGGFLQGKALLTDNAGNVLYIGSFLAEAFLDNSNHAVTSVYGSGAAYKASGTLKGTFALEKNGNLVGKLNGTLQLPPAARRQLIANRSDRMKPLKQIISVVTVVPHYYGARVKGSGQVLHTGFSSQHADSGRLHISRLTILAAAGALVSLLLAGLLYLLEKRRGNQGAPAPAD